jgi:hypothetical protein
MIAAEQVEPQKLEQTQGALQRLKSYLYRQRRTLQQLPRDLKRDWALARWAAQERPRLMEARRRREPEFKSSQHPLVSVLICTYNRGQLLVERTLPSILNQTYQNFEVVIVGDCCPDDTPRRMAEVKDPRVRFLNLSERGRYPRKKEHLWMVAGTVPGNKCLELARGQWIAYLDDDDVFTPDHIEVLLKAAQDRDLELVYGLHQYERTPEEWKTNSPQFPTGRRPYKGNIGHSTALYRSYLTLFKYDTESWRAHLPADWHLWMRMGRCGVRTGFLNKIVTLMPLRPGETAITELQFKN